MNDSTINPVITATCTKCGIEKPLNEEFFRRDKRAKSGFQSACRDCERNSIKAYRAENPDKRRESDVRYHAANADKQREYSKRRYAENPDKARERAARYRAKNPDKVRETQRRWLQANPDKARESTKRWWQANPDKRKGQSHRRRSRERNLLATFTATDWQKALEYFEHRCAYCGRPAGLWHKLAQDHFIPLVSNGTYTPDNIIPACHGADGCNNSKCARDPKEWLTEKFGKRKASVILARIEAYFDALNYKSAYDITQDSQS